MSVKERLGDPDHRLGYRDSTLRSRLTDCEYTAVRRWMRSDRGVIDEVTGEIVNSALDVQRFLRIVPDMSLWD